MREIIGEDANVTCHSWDSDGNYFGICTEDCQIVVYKLGDYITFVSRTPMVVNLISIQIFEIGMVVASSDGTLIFYELQKQALEDEDGFD